MKVIIVRDENAAAKKAYEIIKDRLNNWKINALGLPAGSTPLKLFHQIIEGFKRGELDFTGVHTFDLEEYLGLVDNDERSVRMFMEENLFQHINLDPQNIHSLYGLPDDILNECDGYEQDIEYLGGIKLQILGLGRNGQLALNEAGTSIESRTGLATLAPDTLDDKARFFDSREDVPRWGLTMGIGTILDAEECLLIATGSAKAAAAAAAIEGPVSALCPASALQMHANTTVILDEDAAALLKRAEYYKYSEKIAAKLDAYMDKARRQAGADTEYI